MNRKDETKKKGKKKERRRTGVGSCNSRPYRRRMCVRTHVRGSMNEITEISHKCEKNGEKNTQFWLGDTIKIKEKKKREGKFSSMPSTFVSRIKSLKMSYCRRIRMWMTFDLFVVMSMFLSIFVCKRNNLIVNFGLVFGVVVGLMVGDTGSCNRFIADPFASRLFAGSISRLTTILFLLLSFRSSSSKNGRYDLCRCIIFGLRRLRFRRREIVVILTCIIDG